MSTKEKCVILRNKGFTLGEIIKATGFPKTTIYYHIKDIPLPAEVIERIKQKNTRRINEFNIKVRKGKCVPGRIVIKPKGWTYELIFLIAHFMFDGEITNHSCIYSNRNKALVDQIKFLMRKIFNLKPHNLFNKETGVYRISYHYVELADYMRKKSNELKKRITDASSIEKKIFLQAFFDDEGNVHKYKNIRTVRGFQHNLEILKSVQKLLKDFDIESRIDEKYKEIVISRKPNLIKFRDKINFSKDVYQKTFT
jgi:AcrR family transcriptional regulator